MATVEVTNNAPAGVIIFDATYNDEILIVTGPQTWVAGTILGRNAAGQLEDFDPGAADGTEVPVAILDQEVVFTGAATLAFRVVVGGRVKRNDLVIFLGGTVTPAIADQLRDYGIVSDPVQQLAELDNQ